ncbi:hypothetical protein E9993_15640 [Labilibacter sediminis]|nr:hypothetical protein E9993_15640 [Labilibacter sediminis]
MENNVLIILGMHRSGTSLTAQWLQKCGLNIGDNLMPAHFSNKDGHFEDMDFHDLHEEIFRNHNIPYGGFENIESFKPTCEEVNKIADLVNKKNTLYKQWGWKEPRTCLFIDEYLKLIPNAVILLIIRDYNAVINSLINRDVNSIEQSLLNSGRLGKLRLLKYKVTKGKKEKRKLGNRYSLALKHYYTKLLKLNSPNIIHLKFEDILINENKITNDIESLGFQLNNKIKLSSIIKNNYINAKNKCKYVTDRQSIEELQARLLSL